MQAEFQRTLQSGSQYERYFPTAQLERTDPVVVKSGDTFDTIELMAKLARQYQADTSGLAPVLTGKNLRETLENDWNFAYRHFQYKPDASGVEQLRRPLRAWADRRTGIDCDCYAILLSTLLLNQRIGHKLRKTKYQGRPDYQHIYVVVPKPGGGHYTLDPVTDAFDKEVPFSAKFDKSMMPIQVLNGLADTPTASTAAPLIEPGRYQRFGFAAEFVGVAGEAEQVRQQALATIRQASLQGLAATAGTDRLPTAAELAAIADATGQTAEEATADAVAVAHASAAFIERCRQHLVNTADQIDALPRKEPILVRLRARIAQLLASWTDEARRGQLFAELGAAEEAELAGTSGANLSGLGLGNFFTDAWDKVKDVASSVGSAVSQAATWSYNTVIKPVGQAIGQAASWTADKVATAAKAAAEGIKNAAVWVGNEATALAKLVVKYNPLSVLIRGGLRIAFRVNLFYMSGRLGHGYFSEAQARAFGLDMDEWGKCKSQLGKVISMWEGLQGDTSILQESILLGYESGEQPKIAAAPALSGLAPVLSGLGEPVTATAGTAAASGFIATIVQWLKNVDWDKLLKLVGTVAEKLKLKKAYDSVPAVTDQTVLPASEQDFAANAQAYQTQTGLPTPSAGGSGLLVPLALGAAAVGLYFTSQAKAK